MKEPQTVVALLLHLSHSPPSPLPHQHFNENKNCKACILYMFVCVYVLLFIAIFNSIANILTNNSASFSLQTPNLKALFKQLFSITQFSHVDEYCVYVLHCVCISGLW